VACLACGLAWPAVWEYRAALGLMGCGDGSENVGKISLITLITEACR
jgi:hypothetical protein